MKNKLRMVKMEPGQAPVIKMVWDDYESLRAEVGDLYDMVCVNTIPAMDGIVAFCDDMGKLKRLKPTARLGGMILVGPILFAKEDDEADFYDEEGSGLQDLTVEEAQSLVEYLSSPAVSEGFTVPEVNASCGMTLVSMDGDDDMALLDEFVRDPVGFVQEHPEIVKHYMAGNYEEV